MLDEKSIKILYVLKQLKRKLDQAIADLEKPQQDKAKLEKYLEIRKHYDFLSQAADDEDVERFKANIRALDRYLHSDIKNKLKLKFGMTDDFSLQEFSHFDKEVFSFFKLEMSQEENDAYDKLKFLEANKNLPSILANKLLEFQKSANHDLFLWDLHYWTKMYIGQSGELRTRLHQVLTILSKLATLFFATFSLEMMLKMLMSMGGIVMSSFACLLPLAAGFYLISNSNFSKKIKGTLSAVLVAAIASALYCMSNGIGTLILFAAFSSIIPLAGFYYIHTLDTSIKNKIIYAFLLAALIVASVYCPPLTIALLFACHSSGFFVMCANAALMTAAFGAFTYLLAKIQAFISPKPSLAAENMFKPSTDIIRPTDRKDGVEASELKAAYSKL